jgi:hypothetical protein
MYQSNEIKFQTRTEQMKLLQFVTTLHQYWK